MIIKKNSQSIGKKKLNKEPLKNKGSERSEKVKPEYEDYNEIINNETDAQVVNNLPVQKEIIEEKEPLIDLFDIENIDFTQRQERRRGSRRRGYRRIDDRNLVSRAAEEAENIKKSAFEEGYHAGLKKSEADLEKLRVDIVEFMNARKEVFEYIAPDILEISVDIAKKIIKKELETDPQILLNTIIDVLKTISKNEPKIVIRVKPQSVQFIKDTIPNITYEYGIDSKINIVADPSIEDGGCVFQTNNGIVDASIDTQLEIIKKALSGLN